MGFLRVKSLHRIAVIVFLCAFALGTNMAFADEQPLLVEDTLLAQDTQTRTESGIQTDSPITQPEHMNAQAAPADSTSTNNSESIPLSTFARDNEVRDEAQAEPSNERALTAMEATETKTINMYRLYNPNSGEHFYTGSTAERVHLVDLGWKYEGIGWIAPAMSSSPVYRLYNPNAGDHHYTLSSYERYELVRLGWNDEGIGWYSDDSQRVPLLRQYNPNAKAGAHNFTTSSGENDMLVEAGWKAEGIGWYAVSSVNPAVAQSRIYLDAGHGIGSSMKGVYDSGCMWQRLRRGKAHCRARDTYCQVCSGALRPRCLLQRRLQRRVLESPSRCQGTWLHLPRLHPLQRKQRRRNRFGKLYSQQECRSKS